MIDPNLVFWCWAFFGFSVATTLAIIAWCLWGIHDSLRWQEIERAARRREETGDPSTFRNHSGCRCGKA